MRVCAHGELRWWWAAGWVFVLRWGEVRGGVSWSEGGQCWRVESPYLDKVWQMERDGLIWTVPLDTQNIRMVCLCIYVCVVPKEEEGEPVFHKSRLIAGVVERTGGGWWGRGRVGLHPNPTYRPLTPTSAHMFRVSLQKRENRWAPWGLREFLGAPFSAI